MRFRDLLCVVPLMMVVAAGSAVAAPAQGAAAKAALKTFKVRETSSQADLGGAPIVTIENKFGHVYVKAGTSTIRIEQTAYAMGKDQADATAKAKAFRVTTERDAKEGLRIIVEGDQKNADVGYNLVVSMPTTTKVKVRGSDGDVRIDDFGADVTVDASNGTASIGHVKGKVGASTAAGDITIVSASNGVEAQTSSGSIKLNSAEGKCTLRTMSGGIKAVIGKSPKIIASTMSGKIDVTVTAPFSGDLQASSSSGDIRIAVPTNSDCKVTTATGTGPTKCTLPLVGVKRNGPNYDDGHLGSGKGAVRVTNDSGAIVVVPSK